MVALKELRAVIMNIEDKSSVPFFPGFFNHFYKSIIIFFLINIIFYPVFGFTEGRRREPDKTIQSPSDNSNFSLVLPTSQENSGSQTSEPPKDKVLSPDGARPLGYFEYRFYKSFGSFGMGYGNFRLPVDIDIDKTGDIYVCDHDAGMIQRFDSEGNFQEQWEGFDIKDSKTLKQSQKMDGPRGICVDYKERLGTTVIYVADTNNNRILQFNKDGELINSKGEKIENIADLRAIFDKGLWGEFGSKPGKFHHPTDIAIDGRDNCYILDSKNLKIQCFDEEGNFKFEWGGFGSGYGNFLRPIKLAYDQSGFGSIWVIDAKDGKLHQFELNGDFIRTLIPRDKDKNPLPEPANLFVDSQGFIFLTDSKLNKIFKYNNDLEFIQSWGEEGTGEGQFKGVCGIVVNEDDNVIVVDQDNCRVQIFRRF